MKKLLFIFCFISVTVFAQKYDLGKVTIEELSQTEHPLEKEAPATFLFSKCRNYMDYFNGNFMLITEVEVKIKIYNKEGYDWASVTVPLYQDGTTAETVDFSNAYTYTLVNGKVEKTKLKKEGEFSERINKYRVLKKITMPNVSEGCIIEYKYQIRSPFISSVNDWYFQKTVPVDYSSFSLTTPEYFRYNTNMRGYIFPKKTTTKSERTQTSGTSRFNYTEENNTYTMHNVPSIQQEEFVSNIRNYMASISHELMSIQYPNQPPKFFSTSWEEVTKNIYENDNFGGELKRTGYFEKDIESGISGNKSRDEKVAFLFDYVKNNIKWNENYGYYCDEGVRNAYKNKTGNAAEINLILTAMLRHAGVNANPVLISTRTHGIPLFPSRTAFNYVICAVEIEDDLILLDATDKNALPNILPLRAVNWFGRLIRKEGSSNIVELNPKFISKYNVLMNASLTPDGKATGKVMSQRTDYAAFIQRSNYAGVNPAQYQERLENRYNGIDIENLVSQNLTSDLNKPVGESFEFTDSNDIEIIGDKMYVSPLLFYAMSENPFKREKREYPIDFTFPIHEKHTISIEIPEGYAIESLPKSEGFAITENMASFRYVMNQSGNKIQVMIQEELNAPIISSEHYEDLKNYYQKVVDKHNEKIVLKRI